MTRLAEVFQANGYGTALFSKRPLGDSYPFRPKDRGFEHTVMIRGGGIDQQPNYWGNRNNPPATLYVDDRPVSLMQASGGLAGTQAPLPPTFFTTQAMNYMKQTVWGSLCLGVCIHKVLPRSSRRGR